MRKCDFCEHREYLSNGEEACRKKLLYLKGYKPEKACDGFSITVKELPLIVITIVTLAVVSTLLLCGF